ncbi:hypothetical protein A2U01_0107021, partial [Trifolium medium]|nr:hypothetical protein [Trifolium medium]
MYRMGLGYHPQVSNHLRGFGLPDALFRFRNSGISTSACVPISASSEFAG